MFLFFEQIVTLKDEGKFGLLIMKEEEKRFVFGKKVEFGL